MDPTKLLDELRRQGVPHQLVADAIGKSRPVATKLLSGERSLHIRELEPLTILLKNWRERAREKAGGVYIDANALLLEPGEEDDIISYVPVEVLPTYAGMGGGGTGEGDVEKALVPRYLVEDVFRGRPADFLVVRVRGDSMEPDFHHGDELLVDKRDKSPTQPGPFALWHGDEYVVKNVERLNEDEVRIFSSNPKYTSREAANDNTRIIGRPVWFGRRL